MLRSAVSVLTIACFSVFCCELYAKDIKPETFAASKGTQAGRTGEQKDLSRVIVDFRHMSVEGIQLRPHAASVLGSADVSPNVRGVVAGDDSAMLWGILGGLVLVGGAIFLAVYSGQMGGEDSE